MEALFFVVVYALAAWALFWIIRLGVRYGVIDALERRDARRRRSEAPRP